MEGKHRAAAGCFLACLPAAAKSITNRLLGWETDSCMVDPNRKV